MIVKIKETENYKWIYQDEYNQWFDNRASVLNANIHDFIIEKKTDEVIHRTYKTLCDYSMKCFFLHGNYRYDNYRRKKYNYTFITSGLLFASTDYKGILDYLYHHELIAIQVLDKKTGSIKILVNQEAVNHSLIEELKTQMNMRGFNSRKDIIKLETLSEFIEVHSDIDDSMPFDKVQEDYCIEKAEEALVLLKQSIPQLEDSLEQEEISPVDNNEDNSPL
jgi:hypothetical protein